jgi:hypothetical protein
MPRLFTVALLAALGMTAAIAAQPQDAEWQSLFDGKTLSGWQPNERPESWKIEDGAIVTSGDRSHLFYVGPVANHTFKNFELSAEVMTMPGSNSGIYVHTTLQGPGFPEAGYELQVINSTRPPATPTAYVERKMTGSIYAVRNNWRAPMPDNRWFTYRIKVVGKTIQTFINDALICEYTEPESPWRPDDKKGRLLGSGTFALQAHDPASVVKYRALKVHVLPADLPTPGTALADRELDELITSLSNDNFALIDLGLNPPARGDRAGLARYGDDIRRYGVSPAIQFRADALTRHDASVQIIDDSNQPADVAQLTAAKAAGKKIAFASGDTTTIDPARLKQRLRSIRAAKLSWQDLWVPDNN